jgi:hypothetical protein
LISLERTEPINKVAAWQLPSVKSQIPHMGKPFWLPQIDRVAVEIFTKDALLMVASCYKLPTNNTTDRNDWTRFLAQLEGLLIIGRGFNANDTEWGSRKVCRDRLTITRSVSLHDSHNK